MKKITLCLSLFLLSTQLPFSVYAINSNNLDSSIASSGMPPSSFQCSTLDNDLDSSFAFSNMSPSSFQRSTLDNDFNSLLKKDESLKKSSKFLISIGNAFTQELSESRRMSTSIVQEGLKFLKDMHDGYSQLNEALMKDENMSFMDKFKLFEHLSMKRMKQIKEQEKEISKMTRERKEIENELFDQGLDQIRQVGQEYFETRKEAANICLNELKMKNNALNLDFKREEEEAYKKQAFFKKKREEDLVLFTEENRANLAHQKREFELKKKIQKEKERQERGFVSKR